MTPAGRCRALQGASLKGHHPSAAIRARKAQIGGGGDVISSGGTPICLQTEVTSPAWFGAAGGGPQLPAESEKVPFGLYL